MRLPLQNRMRNRVEDGVTVDEFLPKSMLEIDPMLELEPMEVATMAYQLWRERGCPYGSPMNDWYEAERRIEAGPELATHGTGPREN